MVMIMEMRSAKLLDEACNHYNEVYSDEALYAAWVDAPRIDQALAALIAPAASATGYPGVDAFMARLDARQQRQH